MRRKIFPVLLMVIFAGSLLAASLNAQPMFGRRMMGYGGGAGYQLLKDALQITPEQEKKLEEFRKARLEEAKAHREKMTKLRQEFRTLMTDPKADEKKVNSLIDEMAKLRAERMKAMFKNRKEWEKILTPKQLQKLEEYRKDFQLRRELMPGFRGRMGARGLFLMRHRRPMGY
ncbi:MAG: Spy/CpxP family protein refolding chaperone [Candidatus Saccharicenans sp.]|uniref:Spy/CpxP family protein refolding chaperone n=1 Tax=Candidatus Saccharicenans sp. TaxID=2819258 RepID=UPI00404B4D13